MDKFTPKKIGSNAAIFLVETRKCGKCSKDMVSNSCVSHIGINTFPMWMENNLEAQAKRGGFVLQSRVKVDNQHICTICKDGGLADFLCAICDERKSTEKIKESFGDPPEHICTDCYCTVSAKKWDMKAEELESAHRHDFE